eukprot:4940260-Amphidinium_carterae.2
MQLAHLSSSPASVSSSGQSSRPGAHINTRTETRNETCDLSLYIYIYIYERRSSTVIQARAAARCIAAIAADCQVERLTPQLVLHVHLRCSNISNPFPAHKPRKA